MLTTVKALRYLDPLRAGGSVPGIVEASDLGTYVVKFAGAAQGRKALVAEVVVGELGRRLGLRVPELVLVDFDPAVAAHEPDQEIQDLLAASAGLNLGMDYLPGSRDFRPGEALRGLSPLEAGRIVWLDALTANVDRTRANPNLMVWHENLWLIDNGAGLVFHHRWSTHLTAIDRAYDMSGHALGSYAPDVVGADAELAPRVTPELLREVVALVPPQWLAPEEDGFASAAELREAYVAHLAARVAVSARWLPACFATEDQLRAAEEAARARTAAGRPSWLQQVPRLGGDR
ncbi:HipA family kinase [Kitasatospora sp. NPDC058965]|uniref:HipA family kinase n=1 Tax=Kitasatospora sp. NPDC058965 TaxID=3346682 RepID=UPI0036ADA437